MKRLAILLLTLIIILTLSSCGEPPEVKADFSASFSAQSGDIDYHGVVNRNGDDLTVTMSEPYTVSGMVFTYSDAQLSIRDGAHSTNAAPDYLSANSIPAALRNALLYLSQASYTGSQNGYDSFSVDTPYGEAALTARDGYLTEITEPRSGITFTFSDPSEPNF